jgi:RNA-directed DNA polymerase
MEEVIGVKYVQYKRYPKDANGDRGAPELRYMVKQDSVTVVRYADDFVILCYTKEEAEGMYEKLAPYLEKRGLTLSAEKTRITNIYEGFEFLGHNFRRFQPGNHKRSYYSNPPLVVKPSKKSTKKARRKIAETFKKCTGNNVGALILNLNPIIRGTVNYWRHAISRDTKGKETWQAISALDNYVWTKTRKFLSRLHPNKSWKWIIKRYFKPDHTGQSASRWILTDPDNQNFQIVRAAWTSVKPHIMIRYASSPFDSSLKEYFEMRDNVEFDSINVGTRQKLAKKQSYKCPLCGRSITDGSEGLELHRKTPKCHGGKDTITNLQLVHISCHIDHHAKYPERGTVPTKSQRQSYRAKRNNYLSTEEEPTNPTSYE